MIKDKCLKCGKCCYYLYKCQLVPCKFLNKDNTCTIYDDRIGIIIDIDRENGIMYRCMKRNKYKPYIVGCGYNGKK
jgi:hypothetical protein